MTNTTTDDDTTTVDVIVVGAGFSGLYLAHRLTRANEATGDGSANWSFAGFEAGPSVGGTWFWNTYPGARCDVESIYYSYSFDEQLQQEWTWSQRFAPQAEILRYINHVADRFDLRRHFTFNTRVTAATWNADDRLWEVSLSTGETRRARYLISGAGGLSTPKDFDVPGLTNFTGLRVSTSRWNIDLNDLTGKRVAVIGTGSSGVQAIPLIAEVAEHVTVFQRTPNYVMPARNSALPDDTVDAVKSNYAAIREECRHSLGGIPDYVVTDNAFDVDDSERARRYEEAYERSGFNGVGGEFADLLLDIDANRTASEFIHEKIRGIVTDAATAELLVPKYHPLGAKRSCFGTDYYETFNRPNVSLVSLRDEPIETMTDDCIVTSEHAYYADAVVLAIGFDAFTGPLYGLNLTGASGRKLQDTWHDGVHTYLGMMTADFPNFFMVAGPQSPALASNVVMSIEQSVDWIADLIEHARDERATLVQATVEAEDDWVAITEETVAPTLYATTDSWYRGSNVTGKANTFMGYVGGVGKYRRMCTEIAKRGYPGIAFDGEATARNLGPIHQEIS
ncbi:NAD(P)/FAD-dependent oxidoreductase [Gordonia sp. TBRC 11910]|uniref:NAD(P)/FAD-dependent oxidoreductase n=1 Tax=Gordonia asplenii TaxID=2725283 RepID=A0A848KNL9_9ACTN|nr:NAD(P)/FAD-dependent oxidoreductase [Gordonia asplenii]NMO00644.1 NAD(P)/FAD-dependent oxidoreductase [Gordonia asplenii]